MNVTWPPDANAMARTNGRCQMTSPMPRLAWITATLVLVVAFRQIEKLEQRSWVGATAVSCWWITFVFGLQAIFWPRDAAG